MDIAKISAMFPTVPENKIKELLKKLVHITYTESKNGVILT